jgi:hypothetical protein
LSSATTTDGPDCDWTGGQWQRTEKANAALLQGTKARPRFTWGGLRLFGLATMAAV